MGGGNRCRRRCHCSGGGRVVLLLLVLMLCDLSPHVLLLHGLRLLHPRPRAHLLRPHLLQRPHLSGKGGRGSHCIHAAPACAAIPTPHLLLLQPRAPARVGTPPSHHRRSEKLLLHQHQLLRLLLRHQLGRGASPIRDEGRGLLLHQLRAAPRPHSHRERVHGHALLLRPRKVLLLLHAVHQQRLKVLLLVYWVHTLLEVGGRVVVAETRGVRVTASGSTEPTAAATRRKRMRPPLLLLLARPGGFSTIGPFSSTGRVLRRAATALCTLHVVQYGRAAAAIAATAPSSSSGTSVYVI